MSSIRLYVLATLAERGPLHGHALRQVAEQEHIDEWTDFTVGAVYGALKRMAADGLIEVVRTEREGAYPERQVYGITATGTTALAELRQHGLEHLDLHADAFDLALSTLDPDRLDDLETTLRARRAAVADELTRRRAHLDRIQPHLWAAERWAVVHQHRRMAAEVAYLDDLLADLPTVLSDERARLGAQGVKPS